MAGSRFRILPPTHYSMLNSTDATNLAADEIINSPDRHLLT